VAKTLIVGCGFAGATVARVLAEAGHLVTVLEARPNLAAQLAHRPAAVAGESHRDQPVLARRIVRAQQVGRAAREVE
jgi:glycine/D-amino acid oxidase-like deaminating enzyme